MSVDYDSGKIRTVLYASSDWGEIQAWVSCDRQKSLAVHCDSLNATDCIATVLDVMASRAVQIWPRWYGSEAFIDTPSYSLDDRLHSFLAALELCRRNRSIEPAWLKKVIHLAAAGKPPLATGLVGEIQLRQLALALTGSIVDVTLIVAQTLKKASNCSGFPRVVEWLAREGGLDVTVLLPKEMAANEDLASLLYNAASWSENRIAQKCDGTADETAAPLPTRAASSPFPFSQWIPEESAPEAECIIGLPHPRSRGEQLLAERLFRDPQLSGLFGYNQPVHARCGRRFLVDLLWSAGRVVVEIDGYYYHSNSIAFGEDRDRDYRLFVSGYRVLRLTHDEVVRDVDLALEKVRDVVNFVQQSGSEANQCPMK